MPTVCKAIGALLPDISEPEHVREVRAILRGLQLGQVASCKVLRVEGNVGPQNIGAGRVEIRSPNRGYDVSSSFQVTQPRPPPLEGSPERRRAA